jgi:hypothetical protein
MKMYIGRKEVNKIYIIVKWERERETDLQKDKQQT